VQISSGKSPAAYRFATKWQELFEQAEDSLHKARKRMLKYANQKRRLLEFSVGDKVLLKLTPQIWKKIVGTTKHRGLVPRYDGPFEIIEKVGAVAYRLKLPERLKLHPTFHVSYLQPFMKTTRIRKVVSRNELLLRFTSNLMMVSSRSWIIVDSANIERIGEQNSW